MNANEFRDSIAKLGLSINGAGRFFEVGQATAHRWAKEGTPPAVSMMLKLMIALHVKPAWVNYWLGRKSETEGD
jgi:hypothetical protein